MAVVLLVLAGWQARVARPNEPTRLQS